MLGLSELDIGVCGIGQFFLRYFSSVNLEMRSSEGLNFKIIQIFWHLLQFCYTGGPTKPYIANELFDCILCYDSTDSIKDVGKPAITHRPYIHGHYMYLLSRGMFRLVGFAVRSSKNRHYLGPDHVGSNHARQIQGKHSHKKDARTIYK